jgi:hypothetical protein
MISMYLYITKLASRLCNKPGNLKNFNVSSEEMHNSAVKKLERVDYFLCKVGFCPLKLPQVCKASEYEWCYRTLELDPNFDHIMDPRIFAPQIHFSTR